MVPKVEFSFPGKQSDMIHQFFGTFQTLRLHVVLGFSKNKFIESYGIYNFYIIIGSLVGTWYNLQ